MEDLGGGRPLPEGLGQLASSLLYFGVRFLKLSRHPVELGGERPQLVPIRDLKPLSEIPPGNTPQPRVHLPDRPNERPGDGVPKEEGKADATERKAVDHPPGGA